MSSLRSDNSINNMESSHAVYVPLSDTRKSGRDVSKQGRLKKGRLSRQCVRNLFFCILLSFSFGFNVGVMNSVQHAIAYSLNWCEGERHTSGKRNYPPECWANTVRIDAINTALFAGALLGCRIGAALLGRGRRRALMVASGFFALGGVVSAGCLGFGGLLLGRSISGLGTGIASVSVPLYLAETAPVALRGRVATLHQVFLSVGVLSAVACGQLEKAAQRLLEGGKEEEWKFQLWWRIVLAGPVITSICSLLGFLLSATTDTPAFLASLSMEDEARNAMYELHADDDDDVDDDVETMLLAARDARATRKIGVFEAARDPFYRPALLLGCVVAAAQQLSGVNVFTASTTDIFVHHGFDAHTSMVLSTAMQCMTLVASMCAVAAVDIIGRRPLLIGGAAAQGITLLLSAGLEHLCGATGSASTCPTMTSTVPVSTIRLLFGLYIVIYFFGFGIALGPLAMLYVSEIFPSEIRANGVALCGASNWSVAVIVVAVGKAIAVGTLYRLFGVLNVITAVFFYFTLLETKGSHLDDSPMSPRAHRSLSLIARAQRPMDDQPNTLSSDDNDGSRSRIARDSSHSYKDALQQPSRHSNPSIERQQAPPQDIERGTRRAQLTQTPEEGISASAEGVAAPLPPSSGADSAHGRGRSLPESVSSFPRSDRRRSKGNRKGSSTRGGTSRQTVATRHVPT